VVAIGEQEARIENLRYIKHPKCNKNQEKRRIERRFVSVSQNRRDANSIDGNRNEQIEARDDHRGLGKYRQNRHDWYREQPTTLSDRIARGFCTKLLKNEMLLSSKWHTMAPQQGGGHSSERKALYRNLMLSPLRRTQAAKLSWNSDPDMIKCI
jgi:hypothetical protein